MKGCLLTFFALLAALIIVFYIRQPATEANPQLEKWETLHNQMSFKLSAASRRAKANSSGDALSAEDLSSQDDELRLTHELMEKQVAILESKPTARTQEENDELSNFRRSLAPHAVPTSTGGDPHALPMPIPAVSTARPTAPSAAFLADVAYSQQAAVRKYPTLAVGGSPLNKAFVARLAAWKLRQDARLLRSDWPERLAEECARN